MVYIIYIYKGLTSLFDYYASLVLELLRQLLVVGI